MSNFFDTVQDPAPVGGNYIKAGVNENLVFNGFSIKLDKNNNPMLVRSFYPQGGDPEKTSRSQYESFNPGVRTDSRTKKEVSNYVSWVTSIMHFLQALTTKANVVDIMFRTLPVPASENDDLVPTEEQLTAFIEAINPLVTDKLVRYKFVGEEKESTKNPGTLVTVPSLKVAFIPYAEALSEGAEKPVVAVADTKLKFNPDSKWDLKKAIPVAPDLDGAFGSATDNTGGF